MSKKPTVISNSRSSKPSTTRFVEYYIMMLSVIHGVVLATAASGASEIIKNFSSTGYWEMLRWLISLLFTIATAWKYIIGATNLEWQLDLFDIIIPSLFGITLSASFLLIDDSHGWTWAAYSISICGIFAILNVFIKQKKMQSQKSKPYKEDLRFNLFIEITAVILLPVFWSFYNIAIIPFTTVYFLLAAIAMIALDYFKVWKSLKI